MNSCGLLWVTFTHLFVSSLASHGHFQARLALSFWILVKKYSISMFDASAEQLARNPYPGAQFLEAGRMWQLSVLSARHCSFVIGSIRKTGCCMALNRAAWVVAGRSGWSGVMAAKSMLSLLAVVVVSVESTTAVVAAWRLGCTRCGPMRHGR